ncbi:MAG TPA: hypothetical protein VFL93_13185 [Longimicrobiaceae bacterium]|nr:hypothetical protein [Longimicrobiaceae bacterium]
MKRIVPCRIGWVLPVLLSLATAPTLAAQGGASGRLSLDEGWRIQSSARVPAAGAAIASPGFGTEGWYPATLPATVLGALVTAGVYEDPYFGMNFRHIPGTTYPIGENFSNLPMPDNSPFAVGWWYRKSFRVPAAMRNKRLVLHLDGVNYRANLWLNGKRIADSTEVVGAYRRYALDISDAVNRSGENVLAVEVFPPAVHDLAITWVDWNPAPADKNMGLWHDVYLTSSGDVDVRHPAVQTELASPDRADLTVRAQLLNLSDHAVSGRLRGNIGSIEFSRPVRLAAHDTADVAFTPDSFPQLRVSNPRLWWPATMGEPHLYHLRMSFETNGTTSDREEVPFGIRQITAEKTPEGAELFRINGRPLLIRGGGWSPDLMLRPQPEKQEAELRYVRDMGLNTIRFEAKLGDDRIWERADSAGILIMSGWICCAGWEQWKDWAPEEYGIAAASQRDQMLRLRNHPSALVWLNGSDNPPPAKVEKTYIDVLKQAHWPNPYISSASAKPAEFSGPSGVKMSGPYDWVPPSYWLEDTKHGGAFGYNTETSPGAAPPPIESMRRMLPAEDLWPMDSVWAYHKAGGQFATSDRFQIALARRYGAANSPQDYGIESQVMTYEGERAMFEAYARNMHRSTGVIQWMLNNAWPSTFWHLFDYYLRPGGGYFGAKKALEPVHVQYSYDDRSVVVVNGTGERIPGLRVSERVLNLDATPVFTHDTTLDAPADSSVRAFITPDLSGLSSTYFVDLKLEDANGRPVSSNLYWLSTQPDVLNEDSTQWFVTPVKQYADLTALRTLPTARVDASAHFSVEGPWEVARVKITNPGKTVAFFNRLRLVRASDGEEVLPVLWEDNYVTLLPGDSREVRARVLRKDLEGARPEVRVSGWNVPWVTAP